jgi:hypothetical protein
MHSKATGPTKSERYRWTWFREIGCIPCRLEGEMRGVRREGVPPDVQHVISGGLRVGHAATYPCCPWHHRGICVSGPDGTAYSALESEGILGPSLARDKTAYVARYGDEAALIAMFDRLLAEVLDNVYGRASGEV